MVFEREKYEFVLQKQFIQFIQRKENEVLVVFLCNSQKETTKLMNKMYSSTEKYNCKLHGIMVRILTM